MPEINSNFPMIHPLMGPNSGYTQSPGFRRIDSDGVEEIYSGNLTYLEFIALVKKLWETDHPTIPILPSGVNKETRIIVPDSNPNLLGTDQLTSTPYVSGLEEFPAIIGYSLELRKTHSIEPKPRMRSQPRDIPFTIYGQKFQNVIAFTVMSKVGTFQGVDNTTTRDDLDAAVLCDQVIETFEDFIMEYTPVFKAAGAAELVYSRRLSDSEMSRENKDLHKRAVTYMLTTEKTYAMRHDKLQSIAIDVRTWLASQRDQVIYGATPNYEGTTVTITDLYQTENS